MTIDPQYHLSDAEWAQLSLDIDALIAYFAYINQEPAL